MAPQSAGQQCRETLSRLRRETGGCGGSCYSNWVPPKIKLLSVVSGHVLPVIHTHTHTHAHTHTHTHTHTTHTHTHTHEQTVHTHMQYIHTPTKTSTPTQKHKFTNTQTFSHINNL